MMTQNFELAVFGRRTFVKYRRMRVVCVYNYRVLMTSAGNVRHSAVIEATLDANNLLNASLNDDNSLFGRLILIASDSFSIFSQF